MTLDHGPILASMAGSELPWWSPLAVCAAVLLASVAYWWRHRSRPAGPGVLASEAEARGIPPDRV